MSQTVLITGAARGIGAASARLFAQKGWRVAVHYHTSAAAAQELVDALRAAGCDAAAFPVDLSERAQAFALLERALDFLGHLDALVCNAGISHTGLFQDCTEQDWSKVFSVNLGGVAWAIQAALPDMLSRQAGKIITVSSMWGQTGASCEVAYSASKAAVIGLTRALAQELGPSGITVNCVAPGVIKTAMCAGYSPETLDSLALQTPLGRLGTPEEVAQAIYFLASGQADFFTGQVLCPNGGFVL